MAQPTPDPEAESAESVVADLAITEADQAAATAPETPDGPVAPAKARKETTGQIRGSSLLLVGRTMSMAVNFLVQILIVRYLTPKDYGAFAYALSIVVLGQTLITFGLDRGVSRFLSIYDEHADYDRLLGTIVMVAGTILVARGRSRRRGLPAPGLDRRRRRSPRRRRSRSC